jgi:hypothetical protein
MRLVTETYVETGGGEGRSINIIITSLRANSWLSITLLYFTHPRVEQAVCPTPNRCTLIIVKHYRVTESNSCLAQTNGACIHVFLRTPLIILCSLWRAYHAYSTTPATRYTTESQRRILIRWSDPSEWHLMRSYCTARNDLRRRIRRLLPYGIKV